MRTNHKGIMKNDNLWLLLVVDRGNFFNYGIAFGLKGVSMRNGILP
jgi:hypothetical protein